MLLHIRSVCYLMFSKSLGNRSKRNSFVRPAHNGRSLARSHAPPGIDGDYGMLVPHPARHYAVSTALATPFDPKGLVFQYELRTQVRAAARAAARRLIHPAFATYHDGLSVWRGGHQPAASSPGRGTVARASSRS